MRALAYVDSEVSETLVGAGGSPTESETISESGEAFGLGVDFNIGDRLAFRVDFTKGDEHDIFTLGTVLTSNAKLWRGPRISHDSPLMADCNSSRIQGKCSRPTKICSLTSSCTTSCTT